LYNKVEYDGFPMGRQTFFGKTFRHRSIDVSRPLLAVEEFAVEELCGSTFSVTDSSTFSRNSAARRGPMAPP
jgi:hypothetical protein